MNREEVPKGVNVKSSAVDKAVAEGKFVQVNSLQKTPTMISAGGITNMFNAIAKGTKKVNGNLITPEMNYIYLPDYGLAGPYDDVVTALGILGYADDQLQEIFDNENNVTMENYMEPGTIGYEATAARKAATSERQAARVGVSQPRVSGATNWAELMAMHANASKLQPMAKDNHMEKCSATRRERAKKSQYDGLISRISKRKPGTYLDLNHIDKPANANRAIKWKSVAEGSKVQGVYLDYDDFPIFSNNEANVRRFANQYKKVPVPEGMAKLSNEQVNAAVEEWKDKYQAWADSQASKKKKATITSSTIDKSKIVGAGKRNPVKIQVKKTSTMSRPAMPAADIQPVEELEDQEAGYMTSPRRSRNTTPRVIGAKPPSRRGSRSSMSAQDRSSVQEEGEDEFDDFELS